MVKYLPRHNWQPTILTVKEDTFTKSDLELLKEVDPELKVIHTDFWDPFILYKKLLGKKEDQSLVASESISKINKSFAQKFSIWLRMNFFIPDARIGWYFPGLREASKLLREERYDAIVSNGPPHSTHLLAERLSRKFNIPLVSVFIDPWVDIAYYKGQQRSKITKYIDNSFERKIIKNSNKLVFVTNSMKEYFYNKYPGTEEKSSVLHWGYNEEDFENVEIVKNDGEVLLHAGNIFDFQNPVNLWRTVKREIENGRKLKIRFVGTVSPAVKKSIEEFGLSEYTEYKGYLPYKDVIKEVMSADYLLVCATEPRHTPGKLFEYLRARKPIIAFADNNRDVKRMIEESNSGMVFRYDENPSSFFNNSNELKCEKEITKKYERKNIAIKLAGILNNIK
jgi:glycosyltransferase involved in cell wall biosynthesis